MSSINNVYSAFIDDFSLSIESACVHSPCKNNATCQTGFPNKGYRCLCTAGFQGQDCQNGEEGGRLNGNWKFINMQRKREL